MSKANDIASRTYDPVGAYLAAAVMYLAAVYIVILLMILAQLLLGLITIPYSLQHPDGAVMLELSEWAQRIVTLRGGAAELVADVAWVYRLHLVLGLTLFVVFPFSRLVHIWSAPVWYVFRPYQVVRRRTANARVRTAP